MQCIFNVLGKKRTCVIEVAKFFNQVRYTQVFQSSSLEHQIVTPQETKGNPSTTQQQCTQVTTYQWQLYIYYMLSCNLKLVV